MTISENEQNALNRLDILIENNVAAWNSNIEGDILGTYRGLFKFRCYLSPLQQISANKEYRELLGTNPSFASEHESFLAYALTQLKYRIISFPPYWSSTNPNVLNGDVPDENVISAVLDAALMSEMKYKATLKKSKLEAIERSKKLLEESIKGTQVEKAEEE